MADQRGMVQEFGGYLPFELARGKELYADRQGWNVGRFNSGRTALRSAFMTLDARRIFYPSYYCPSTLAAIQSWGIETVPYQIGLDLLPESCDFGQQEGDVVLIVDYFGVRTECMSKLLTHFEKVVVDNCHSFFVPPYLREGVVTVYSCRKFLGVADGAYAIASFGLTTPDWPQDATASRTLHLLGSLEEGTGAYYKESIESKVTLCEERLMSTLTHRMLDSIEYDDVQKRRQDNYRVLHKELENLQLMSVPPEPTSPWCYPLLTNKELRQRLVSRHVYVPRIWETWVGAEPSGKAEWLFSNKMVCLPVDQRYDEHDMRVLAQIVREEWSDAK